MSVPLERFSVLGELTESERELLDDLFEPRQLDAGEVLFREGQESEGLILVEDGALVIESERAGQLGQVPAGGHMGGVSLVSVGQREVTAAAGPATQVLLLTREAFRRLVDDAPRVGCRILETCVVEFAGVVREALDRIQFRNQD